MKVSLAMNQSAPGIMANIGQLCSSIGPEQVYICGRGPAAAGPDGLGWGRAAYEAEPVTYGGSLKSIIGACGSTFLILLLKSEALTLEPSFLTRIEAAFGENPKAMLLYAAHRIIRDQTLEQPLIDYQAGSIRDDFDFGPLVVLHLERIQKASPALLEGLSQDGTGWYGLRLLLSHIAPPIRLGGVGYEIRSIETSDSEKEHFSYVDPGNADYQKKLEKTFSAFAKQAGFYLAPGKLKSVDVSAGEFPVTASVIIPVRNRARTISDAVASALSQKCSFDFNIIVVDNHSNDGTTESLASLAARDSRLQHLIPQANDLQIGGCWNLAVNSQSCGRFAVQLDSDDIYQDENTLQKIVDCFYETKAAAVVGSYTIVDMNLKPLPPGLIDHREWTAENGHNNALRINGFGAPRAYFTPVIREVQFPNLSYGEDYAAMLGISRTYRIARIYESLYLCRRWDGNSDANPSIEKMNRFNAMKDGLRSAEIMARKALSLK